MKNLKWLIVVDVFLIITFVLSFFFAIVVWRIIPGTGEEVFWGISSAYWGEMHMFVNLIFVILFIIHFLLHWVGIKDCYPNGNGAK